MPTLEQLQEQIRQLQIEISKKTADINTAIASPRSSLAKLNCLFYTGHKVLSCMMQVRRLSPAYYEFVNRQGAQIDQALAELWQSAGENYYNPAVLDTLTNRLEFLINRLEARDYLWQPYVALRYQIHNERMQNMQQMQETQFAPYPMSAESMMPAFAYVQDQNAAMPIAGYVMMPVPVYITPDYQEASTPEPKIIPDVDTVVPMPKTPVVAPLPKVAALDIKTITKPKEPKPEPLAAFIAPITTDAAIEHLVPPRSAMIFSAMAANELLSLLPEQDEEPAAQQEKPAELNSAAADEQHKQSQKQRHKPKRKKKSATPVPPENNQLNDADFEKVVSEFKVANPIAFLEEALKNLNHEQWNVYTEPYNLAESLPYNIEQAIFNRLRSLKTAKEIESGIDFLISVNMPIMTFVHIKNNNSIHAELRSIADTRIDHLIMDKLATLAKADALSITDHNDLRELAKRRDMADRNSLMLALINNKNSTKSKVPLLEYLISISDLNVRDISGQTALAHLAANFNGNNSHALLELMLKKISKLSLIIGNSNNKELTQQTLGVLNECFGYDAGGNSFCHYLTQTVTEDTVLLEFLKLMQTYSNNYPPMRVLIVANLIHINCAGESFLHLLDSKDQDYSQAIQLFLKMVDNGFQQAPRNDMQKLFNVLGSPDLAGTFFHAKNDATLLHMQGSDYARVLKIIERRYAFNIQVSNSSYGKTPCIQAFFAINNPLPQQIDGIRVHERLVNDLCKPELHKEAVLFVTSQAFNYLEREIPAGTPRNTLLWKKSQALVEKYYFDDKAKLDGDILDEFYMYACIMADVYKLNAKEIYYPLFEIILRHSKEFGTLRFSGLSILNLPIGLNDFELLKLFVEHLPDIDLKRILSETGIGGYNLFDLAKRKPIHFEYNEEFPVHLKINQNIRNYLEKLYDKFKLDHGVIGDIVQTNDSYSVFVPPAKASPPRP